MYDLKVSSVCKVGKMIPTGNNPECRMSGKNKLVDKNLFESTKTGDDVDLAKFRDEVGD